MTTVTCRNCGRVNPDGAEFCADPACGAYLNWDATRAAPVPAPVDVRIELTEPFLTVAPGAWVATEATVRHSGSEARRFRVTVGGDAGSWATAGPAEVDVAPGTGASCAVTLAPPPSAPAGTAAFDVRVESVPDGAAHAAATGVLTVEAAAVAPPPAPRPAPPPPPTAATDPRRRRRPWILVAIGLGVVLVIGVVVASLAFFGRSGSSDVVAADPRRELVLLTRQNAKGTDQLTVSLRADQTVVVRHESVGTATRRFTVNLLGDDADRLRGELESLNLTTADQPCFGRVTVTLLVNGAQGRQCGGFSFDDVSNLPDDWQPLVADLLQIGDR